MATGQHPRRTSGAFTVKSRKLLWFGHACHHDTLPNIQGIVMAGVAEEYRVNSGRTTSRNERQGVDGQSSQQMHMSEYRQRRLGISELVFELKSYI